MMYSLFKFFFRCLFFCLYRLEAKGLEHIPTQGAVIICCNHFSYIDPPLLGTPLPRKIHFMAKAELFKIPVLGWLIDSFGAYPVKRGGVSKEAIRHSLKLLSEGKMLGIFPEGSTKNLSGVGQKGAASLAVKSKATVIPAAIIGRYIPFRKMRIAYGAPIDLSVFTDHTSTQGLEQMTEAIMKAIGDLKKQ